MASNEPTGDTARKGAVKKRTHLKTAMYGEEHWTKRDKETCQFLDENADEEKFKGVRSDQSAVGSRSIVNSTFSRHAPAFDRGVVGGLGNDQSRQWEGLAQALGSRID